MSSTTSNPAARRTGRHPVSIGHLVMGVAFLGMVLTWGLYESDLVSGDELRWLAPLPWLAAGLAGLAAVTFSSRRRGPAGETWQQPVAADQEPGTAGGE